MSKIASFVPPEPEPEKPKTVEEQIAAYRTNYRNLLKRDRYCPHSSFRKD